MKSTQKRPYAVFIIGSFVILANFWHVIHQWILNKPGEYFIGIAHYYADYFLYTSQILQGIRGHWIMADQLFTNEPLAPTWVYWPNVLIGRLGSIFSHSPFVLYLTALVMFVIVFLALLWHLITRVFPRSYPTQVLAFFITVTASNFIRIAGWNTGGKLTLAGSTWFSPTPALNRLGGVPHQTLQTVMLLSVLLSFTSVVSPQGKTRRINAGQAVLFFIVCFLTATLSPTQMVLVSMTIGVVTLAYIRNTPRVTQLLILALGGIGAAGLGAFMVNRAFDSSQLFTVAKAWEASQYSAISPVTLFLAMGPIILLIPFGIRRYCSHLSPLRLALLTYGALSLVIFFSPLPHILGTSNTRWIHPASYIVFPLLATAGLLTLSSLLSRLTYRLFKRRNQSVWYFLFITLYVSMTIPAIIAQIDMRSGKDTASFLYGTINHVPIPAIQALALLRHAPQTGVVLTDPALLYDVLVPSVSGKPSFTGHPVHTLYASEKEHLRSQFFNGAMSTPQMQQFLTDHRIGYLLVHTGSPLPLLPHLFHALGRSGDITVYTVTAGL